MRQFNKIKRALGIRITHHDVMRALREEIKGNEDYRYQRSPCKYVYNGKPDCLAGRILYRLGVSLSYLSDNEGLTAKNLLRVYSSLFEFWPSRHKATADARRLLDLIQRYQDKGLEWGQVYWNVQHEHVSS